jgi:dTDP-4-amino-4,6-dideoxygalactose transaminase
VPENEYDLIVIGGGPAGTCGANTAAILGRRVALIEKEPDIGGAGINSGTLPSKTLRETALALSGWRSRRLFGVDLSLRREATINDLTYHKDAVCKAERQHLESRLTTLHVQRLHGTASFINQHTIRVTQGNGSEIQLSAAKFLIATGSSPWRPPEFEFADDRVHDSDELLHLRAFPKRLVVIGAGVIGSEYACTFAAMDVETHLVDARNMLLPFLDDEISHALAGAMCTNGVHFHWNERVTRCDVSHPQEVVLTLSSGAQLSADGVLVCAGRSSNTAALNLSAAGITPGPRGVIAVDVFGQCADYTELRKITTTNDLFLVEDAACSTGATYHGLPAGHPDLADIAAFSLHGRKGITCGEGGVVTSADSKLVARMRKQAAFGIESALARQGSNALPIPVFGSIGYNYKLSDIAAAIAVVQLGRLPHLLSARRTVAARYDTMFADCELLTTPTTGPDRDHTYQAYVLTLDPSIDRDAVAMAMRAQGIGANIGTYASHLQPVYDGELDCPVSADIFGRHLAIPMHANLSDDDIEIVGAVVRTSILDGRR